ncbi:MAG: energy-coupling factor transporter ATPase [Halanaerobiales bacterium]|nr:energy-coupling factor transporter ATPase [Halanaerobiales bacterium]
MEKAVISIKNMSFTYKETETPAVQDINLEIYKGQIVLLLGKSGCGKSTLSLAINGLIPHLIEGEIRGSVETCGINISEQNSAEMSKKTGFVFQDPEVQLFSMTVEDEVAMSLSNMAVPLDEMRSQVDWALETVGMRGFELQDPASLSGGEKQRVAIASVLARNPELLIFDEPTGNLDPVASRKVYQTIKDICSSGNHTVIIAEKDLGALIDFVDYVVLLDKGKIVSTGTPREILQQVELLKKCGVRVPACVQLGLELQAKGFSYPKLPITAEELVKPLGVFKTAYQSDKPNLDSTAQKGVVIEFDQVTHQFKNGYKGLDNISIKINKGEFISILGMNGAGKSTLVSHIIGLLRPTKGTVLVNNEASVKFTVAEMARRVGFIFQNPNHQIFNDTVHKEITFGPKNLGWAEEEIERAAIQITRVASLEGMENKDPEGLSIGEKQRVALASILVMDPDILILDEPTTGQDQNSLDDMMAIVAELHRRGKTIIMITHDMDVALQYSNRVALMHKGKILWQGPVQEAFFQKQVLEQARLNQPEVLKIANLILKENTFIRDLNQLRYRLFGEEESVI